MMAYQLCIQFMYTVGLISFVLVHLHKHDSGALVVGTLVVFGSKWRQAEEGRTYLYTVKYNHRR